MTILVTVLAILVIFLNFLMIILTISSDNPENPGDYPGYPCEYPDNPNGNIGEYADHPITTSDREILEYCELSAFHETPSFISFIHKIYFCRLVRLGLWNIMQ